LTAEGVGFSHRQIRQITNVTADSIFQQKLNLTAAFNGGGMQAR